MLRKVPVADKKHDETFKVVDRRLFNAAGELREDIAEEQRREQAAEANRQQTPAAPPAAKPGAVPAAPAADVPKPSLGFKTLIGFLARNAELVLAGFPDPRTGEPTVDLGSLQQIIDMFEALREKSKGNLAPEEEQTINDVIGDLKYTFLQLQQQAVPPPPARKPAAR